MSEKKKQFAFLYRINPIFLIGITAVMSIFFWLYGSTILFYIANPGGWQAIAERDTFDFIQVRYKHIKNIKMVSRELVDKEENLFVFYYVINGEYRGKNVSRHILALFERYKKDGGKMADFSVNRHIDSPPDAEKISKFKERERH
jgi:hypothetical protein